MAHAPVLYTEYPLLHEALFRRPGAPALTFTLAKVTATLHYMVKLLSAMHLNYETTRIPLIHLIVETIQSTNRLLIFIYNAIVILPQLLSRHVTAACNVAAALFRCGARIAMLMVVWRSLIGG
jgi:hypothetical protein